MMHPSLYNFYLSQSSLFLGLNVSRHRSTVLPRHKLQYLSSFQKYLLHNIVPHIQSIHRHMPGSGVQNVTNISPFCSLHKSVFSSISLIRTRLTIQVATDYTASRIVCFGSVSPLCTLMHPQNFFLLCPACNILALFIVSLNTYK